MNGFAFSLQPLLEYRKNRRDLCRQLLAQILGDDTNLASQRLRLWTDRERQFEQFRRLSRRGRVSVDAAAMRRYHSGQILTQIGAVDEKRRLVAQQLQLCREALTRADSEVKALERLEKNQRAAFIYQAERRAQHEREDAWTARRILERAQ